MKYLGSLRDLIRITRIIRRYILNVRKFPLKMPIFISILTEAQNDVISKCSEGFRKITVRFKYGDYLNISVVKMVVTHIKKIRL